MFSRILVAVDGSEGGKKALAAAVSLASKLGAELESISVREKPSHFVETVGEVMEEQEEADRYFARVTAEASALAEKEGVKHNCAIWSGHEVETIVHYLREGHFDLLVIGFMGHSRVFGRIWGGTSQNLTKTSPCSVLVVK